MIACGFAEVIEITEVPGSWNGLAHVAPQFTDMRGWASSGSIAIGHEILVSDRGQATLWLTIAITIYTPCALHSSGRNNLHIWAGDWDRSLELIGEGRRLLLKPSVGEFEGHFGVLDNAATVSCLSPVSSEPTIETTAEDNDRHLRNGGVTGYVDRGRSSRTHPSFAE